MQNMERPAMTPRIENMTQYLSMSSFFSASSIRENTCKYTCTHVHCKYLEIGFGARMTKWLNDALTPRMLLKMRAKAGWRQPTMVAVIEPSKMNCHSVAFIFMMRLNSASGRFSYNTPHVIL